MLSPVIALFSMLFLILWYLDKGVIVMNEELREACPHISCGQCIWFTPTANMDWVESSCKRLDHKKYQFAVPWFKSYDCGQYGGICCRDFSPRKDSVYLYNHWKGFDDYFGEIKDTSAEIILDNLRSTKGLIGLCVDKDQSVQYYVKSTDFINNTFLDEEGNLKWIKRCYYKQTRKSPLGYELIYEYNDKLPLNK